MSDSDQEVFDAALKEYQDALSSLSSSQLNDVSALAPWVLKVAEEKVYCYLLPLMPSLIRYKCIQAQIQIALDEDNSLVDSTIDDNRFRSRIELHDSLEQYAMFWAGQKRLGKDYTWPGGLSPLLPSSLDIVDASAPKAQVVDVGNKVGETIQIGKSVFDKFMRNFTDGFNF